MTAAVMEQKKERITARIAQSAFEKIEYAAALQGATINQFLVNSALHNAEEIIEHERSIKLSNENALRFIAILEEPPMPNTRLRAAFQSFQEDSLHVERKD